MNQVKGDIYFVEAIFICLYINFNWPSNLKQCCKKTVDAIQLLLIFSIVFVCCKKVTVKALGSAAVVQRM